MLEWLTPEFYGYLMLRHLRDLVLAYLLTIPSAWDREVRDRAVGLRTFTGSRAPLSRLASAA